MITVTNRETSMAAYIPVIMIQDIEPHAKYTRVYIRDSKQGHDYFLDVKERPDEIRKLIKQYRKRPERKKPEEPISNDV